MSRKSSRYALAVGGAGIGGLAVAALLLRQGKKVVLLEPSSSVGGVLAGFSKDGFVFSPGLDLTYGFERSGSLEMLCSDLGISLGASVLSPCYQVVLPDHRVNVYREQGETLDELRREFPADIDAFARFYREIRRIADRCAKSRLAAFFASRRSSGGFLGRFRFNTGARAFLDASSFAFFQRPATELPLNFLVMLFDTAPLFVRDGFPFLAEQVAAFILKEGGEIIYGAADVDLLQRNGRSAGLVISSGLSYESEATLLNTPNADTCSGHFFGVNDTVIPVGMARNVFCLPAYDRFDLFFTLSLSPRESTTAAPHGMRTIAALFPFLKPASLPDSVRLDVIADVIPFLNTFTLTATELPRRKDICPYPERSLRRPIRGMLSGYQAHSAELKDLYILRDDPRSPLNSISAAQALCKVLLT